MYRRTQWEYCILTAIETTQQRQFSLAFETGGEARPDATSRLDIMSELGRQGWELTGVRELAPGALELYFKREL